MTSTNPQELTIRGRLSWPTFSHAAAVKRNAKSDYPKADASEVKPDFSLLLTQVQADKLVAHLRDEFLPWAEEQGKKGERSGLEAGQAKKLRKVLDEADWETEGIVNIIGPVHEKTAELAPEAVMQVKVSGQKGRDLPQKAIVRQQSELRVPDEELVIPARGLILPVSDTNLELYPGSIVGATINLYAFVSGKTPGIIASTAAAIFLQLSLIHI